MNAFNQFAAKRGLITDSAAYNLARDAWDAALCEAGSACFTERQLRPAGTIHAEITRLHTWHETPAQTPTTPLA